jgi:hypothetical protein
VVQPSQNFRFFPGSHEMDFIGGMALDIGNGNRRGF